MTKQERADRIAEMREQGKTYGQIGLALNLSGSNISWICLKYGIEGTRKPTLGDRGPAVMKRGKFEVRKFTPDEDETITRMEMEGASRASIGRALGRRANSILGRQMTLARREEQAVGEIMPRPKSEGGAILMSMLLQYGCPPSDIAHAMKRNPDGSPASPLGRAAAFLIEGERTDV